MHKCSVHVYEYLTICVHHFSRNFPVILPGTRTYRKIELYKLPSSNSPAHGPASMVSMYFKINFFSLELRLTNLDLCLLASLTFRITERFLTSTTKNGYYKYRVIHSILRVSKLKQGWITSYVQIILLFHVENTICYPTIFRQLLTTVTLNFLKNPISLSDNWYRIIR